MNLTLYKEDAATFFLENYYPEFYINPDNAVTEKIHRSQTQFGEAFYQELFFEGIRVSYGQAALANNCRLYFENDYDTVEMHFVITGHINTASVDGLMQLDVAQHHHNIVFIPGMKGKVEFMGNQVQVFEVNMPPSFFKRFLTNDYDIVRKFKKSIDTATPASLFKHHLPITPQMLMLIKEITNCQRTGIFKRMFLEAKVIELLLLQLEQQVTHNCDTFCSIKKSDIEKMHHAKELIVNNMNNPCTLIDLAHQIGTNEFTLKKGFKEVYGTTVFGYLNELKMESARQMLQDQRLTVKEVAFRSGYKNPTHFTAAFKKKYGFTPGSLKK